jgi:sugar lactone lactonase YvrE
MALISKRQMNGKINFMQNLIKPSRLIIYTLAAMLLAPRPARADRLLTGDYFGTILYEFDTSVGEFSKAVFCDQTEGVTGLIADGKGNLFESNYRTCTIYKFTPDGKHSTFAILDSPGSAMAFDREGNLFVPYQWGHRIDKLSPDGSTSSVFAADLPKPVQLDFNRQGDLFAADQDSGCVYKFDPYDGTRTTFATGLRSPIGLVFDRHGILFVADPPASIIYKYSTNGVRTTFARHLRSPCSLAFDRHGNLFMTDGSGSVFEFKNKGGTLATTPTLFASGLGHNFFMTIMPGSMSTLALLSKSLSSWKFWAPLVLLVAAGVGCGLLLRRKMRRAASVSTSGSSLS